MIAVLGVVLAGCTGPSEDPSCPDDLPDACPDPAPTWSHDASGAVAATCANCHDGTTATPVLDDQATVHADRAAVLGQVYGCLMPPPASGYSLTAEQRANLLGWLVCGAPND